MINSGSRSYWLSSFRKQANLRDRQSAGSHPHQPGHECRGHLAVAHAELVLPGRELQPARLPG